MKMAKLRQNSTDRLVKFPQDGTVHWYHFGPNCLRVGGHASAKHKFVDVCGRALSGPGL